jgi:lysozyme
MMSGMKFEVVDGCPVPVEAAPLVHAAKQRTGETLNSCFRGVEARAILNAHGKHDQAYLYQGWLRRLPGFNPANPPGSSPHECRSDGVSPPGFRRGARIPAVLVGQDWGPDAWRVVAAYRAMGVPAYHPYASAFERQHVGIASVPKKMPGALEEGVRDRRVTLLKRALHVCVRPKSGGKHYWPFPDRKPNFTPALAQAIRDFQHDHGLKPDGIVGHMTQVQIDHAFAFWTARAKAKAKAAPKPPVAKRVVAKVTRKLAPAKVTPGPHFGIDVYEGNGDIDWAKVRASGHAFAFVKATEGLDFVDHRFGRARLDAARKAGILVGCYHFARPQPGRSANAEAQHYLRHAHEAGAFAKGDLPAVLDIESVRGLGTKQLQDWVATWCSIVSKATGTKPIIYTGAWFWEPSLGNPGRGFGGYPLWLAAYVSDARRYVPKAWKTYTFWQFTDKGHVPGVPVPCDVNRYEGTLESLHALTIR